MRCQTRYGVGHSSRIPIFITVQFQGPQRVSSVRVLGSRLEVVVGPGDLANNIIIGVHRSNALNILHARPSEFSQYCE